MAMGSQGDSGAFSLPLGFLARQLVVWGGIGEILCGARYSGLVRCSIFTLSEIGGTLEMVACPESLV